MSGTKGNGATRLAKAERERTDSTIMAILEKHGVLSRSEMVAHSGLPDSTVWLSVERLRKEGCVRKLDEMRRVGKRGNMACVYELGCEEDAPLHREPVVLTIHRHAQDVALFGEYVPVQREAA
jgi:predicted transcriptional regulator